MPYATSAINLTREDASGDPRFDTVFDAPPPANLNILYVRTLSQPMIPSHDHNEYLVVQFHELYEPLPSRQHAEESTEAACPKLSEEHVGETGNSVSQRHVKISKADVPSLECTECATAAAHRDHSAEAQTSRESSNTELDRRASTGPATAQRKNSTRSVVSVLSLEKADSSKDLKIHVVHDNPPPVGLNIRYLRTMSQSAIPAHACSQHAVIQFPELRDQSGGHLPSLDHGRSAGHKVSIVTASKLPSHMKQEVESPTPSTSSCGIESGKIESPVSSPQACNTSSIITLESIDELGNKRFDTLYDTPGGMNMTYTCTPFEPVIPVDDQTHQTLVQFSEIDVLQCSDKDTGSVSGDNTEALESTSASSCELLRSTEISSPKSKIKSDPVRHGHIEPGSAILTLGRADSLTLTSVSVLALEQMVSPDHRRYQIVHNPPPPDASGINVAFLRKCSEHAMPVHGREVVQLPELMTASTRLESVSFTEVFPSTSGIDLTTTTAEEALLACHEEYKEPESSESD